MKLTKKSFRDRVKKLFAKSFNYVGTVTNSVLKKFFPDFRVSVSESWADLADRLVMIEEKSELELACEKYNVSANLRYTDCWSIYQGQIFLGEISKNLLGIWYYTFRSNGSSRRSQNLETALRVLLNNHQANLKLVNKPAEFYDLFSA